MKGQNRIIHSFIFSHERPGWGSKRFLDEVKDPDHIASSKNACKFLIFVHFEVNFNQISMILFFSDENRLVFTYSLRTVFSFRHFYFLFHRTIFLDWFFQWGNILRNIFEDVTDVPKGGENCCSRFFKIQESLVIFWWRTRKLFSSIADSEAY